MRALVALLALLLLAPLATATFPYPAPPAGTDPNDYAAYLRLPPGVLPTDYAGGDVWKYSSLPSGEPDVDHAPHELGGVTGMSVDLAWRVTTGRPDVVIAVLDSGIIWSERELAHKVHLNTGELPLPAGCSAYDCDANGVVNVRDYAGTPDANGNGILDGQDLIRAWSDGVDDDANGYVDDIAGWNALDNNNDPSDEVRYGHGTGEGEDSTGEADNGGFVGTCPSCSLMPIRVGQSFIATSHDYAEGVYYAVDNGADVIQEALGTVDGSAFGRQAAEHAHAHGVPVIASAADEASYHHNLPSAYEHAIVVNSVTKFDEVAMPAPRSYLYLNGCTNFGANMALAVSSTSCSSEATGRSAGIAGLLLSAARNRGVELTANEVRQLMTQTADDIDFTGDRAVVSPIPTLRYPSAPGFDTYFGYGRLNADRAVRAVDAGLMPPEAEVLSPTWWQPVDPVATPTLHARAYVAARHASSFGWTLEAGCGLAPLAWHVVGSEAHRTMPGHVTVGIDAAALDRACIGMRAPAENNALEPNEHGVTLRLRVTDDRSLVGEHRKYFFLWHDADALPGFPRDLGSGGEQSPRMADLTGDGRPELVVSTSAGDVHVFDVHGHELPGWPARTGALSWGAPHHESILHGGVAIADITSDGRPEVVAATHEGTVYAWDAHGALLAGFPVWSDPAYSSPAIRDRYNRLLPGFLAAPVLADLDGDGERDVLVAGQDRHLYAWRSDGAALPNFPMLVIDRAMVDIDPVTHKVRPKPGVTALQGSKIVSTPAIADLDGDGAPEIVVGHNEEYEEVPDFSAQSAPGLAAIAASGLLGSGNGRLHAMKLDGTEAPGWPVRIANLATELLPTVGDGIPASASIADIDADGSPEIAILSTAGPVYLLRADGSSYYGDGLDGKPRVMGDLALAADEPLVPGLGIGVLADPGTGRFALYAPAAGAQRALDVALPAEQVGAVDYLMGWDAATGAPLPTWPRVQEDLQFITSPSVVDIDGDGLAEVLSPSAGYYLHAYGVAAGEPLGWPKFTGHWLIATPAVGDMDGDGVNEVAITSREGWLFVWRAPGHAGDIAPWPTIHHDNANTGNAATSITPWGDVDDEGAGAWAWAGAGAGNWGLAALALLAGRIAWRRRSAPP